jgi:hypothetical protein
MDVHSPEFYCYNTPKRETIYLNGEKYQMAVKKTKRPKNMPTSSFARPSQIYPNWDFWFENIQSGNPGLTSPTIPVLPKEMR